MSNQSPNKEITSKVITRRNDDYSQWYNDLVIKGGLADYSAVRGCMVIKPYGYAIWEKMQATLDKMFKETGHVNAYFPLFVPRTFLEKEEGHAEGFAKECAVVTHYRLKANPEKKGTLMVDPESKLEEELIVRPTSEAIIWNSYKSWIRSYRDLPLLINQWANVVRWEMRTRLFLRTTEFLWQEGHTAHATKDEAFEEARKILEIYAAFAEQWMALPVIKGVKTANERFAGAEETFCIEALVQDGKAIQAGTSHFLGQNFAKAFDVTFTNRENQVDFVWGSSWGVTTRLIGTLIMAHSDDNGLVLPPRLAPIQVVIIPISRNEEQLNAISEKVLPIKKELEAKGISVKYDNEDKQKPGWKFAEYEMKGVPIRIAIGPRDLENNSVEVARRDLLSKQVIPMDGLVDVIIKLLDEIQISICNKSRTFRDANIIRVDSYDEFKRVLDSTGGFISAHWDGTAETENKIKDETKATIRCIPLNNPMEEGKCILTGKPSKERVLFARAY